MYKIVSKKMLNSTVCQMEIEASAVAKKAEAGQFVILRVNENGERIPLTIAGFNRESGFVKIIFQIVGATTQLLYQKEPGEFIQDFVGPLGKATEVEGLKNVCVIGGGVGCAIAFPVAEKLFSLNCNTTTITGFRNKDLVILQDEFKNNSKNHICVTDDGSFGEQGNVCVPLEKLLSGGERFDMIFAIGPIVMMKFVVLTAKKYNIPCTVSMNPIMIDGTGMCGCCRLLVDGQIKFACIEGPDFDGYKVDFDDLASRNRMYLNFEQQKREETCNLFNKEIK